VCAVKNNARQSVCGVGHILIVFSDWRPTSHFSRRDDTITFIFKNNDNNTNVYLLQNNNNNIQTILYNYIL